MSKAESGSNQEEAPLWRYIRLDQYSTPPEPAKEVVRKGFWGLWDRLRNRGSRTSVFDEGKLGAVPGALLEQVVAAPNWDHAAQAVTQALEEWLAQEPPDFPVRLLVGPPYGGLAESLQMWAKSQGWQLLAPPDSADILAGGSDWLTLLETGSSPVVLANLEKCFLRYADGLMLLRRLLDQLFTGNRRTLIGCDSWAWSLLSQLIQIDSVFPTPLILEAFDQDRLKAWFYSLDCADCGFLFRQLDNGGLVLPPRNIDLLPSSLESSGITDFLKGVAAYSRGIPGVAWAIWRNSLQSAKEEIDSANRLEAGDEEQRTIWVRPWSRMKLPSVPDYQDRNLLIFVLHALLLHNGLPSQILPDLLPYSPTEIVEALHLLQAAGVATSSQGFWRVTPLGYPAARKFLHNQGYLTDAV